MTETIKALRHLSLVLLKQNIQSTSNGRGHCSIEDAAAALTLAIRRARLGDSFNLRKRPRGKFMIELIDDVRKRTAEGTPHHYASMATRNRGALVCIGPKSWIKSHAPTKSTAHILTCESVLCRSQEAILSWLRNGKRRAAFLCANLVVPHNSEGVAKADELIVSDSAYLELFRFTFCYHLANIVFPLTSAIDGYLAKIPCA